MRFRSTAALKKRPVLGWERNFSLARRLKWREKDVLIQLDDLLCPDADMHACQTERRNLSGGYRPHKGGK